VIVSRLFGGCYAGIIGNGLVQSRQIIEHGGLPRIGLSHKSDQNVIVFVHGKELEVRC